ncbi:hypothetical protein [Pseudomonas grandcourensis]|uniref:hypothetical protein n=1 Tax=Pseudomonas grandcourensis TaxID=3136736 RepID=UPI003264F3B1
MNTTCSQAKSQLSKKAEIQSFFQAGAFSDVLGNSRKQLISPKCQHLAVRPPRTLACD